MGTELGSEQADVEPWHPHTPGRACTVCPGLEMGPAGHGAPVSTGQAEDDVQYLVAGEGLLLPLGDLAW